MDTRRWLAPGSGKTDCVWAAKNLLDHDIISYIPYHIIIIYHIISYTIAYYIIYHIIHHIISYTISYHRHDRIVRCRLQSQALGFQSAVYKGQASSLSLTLLSPFIELRPD